MSLPLRNLNTLRDVVEQCIEWATAISDLHELRPTKMSNQGKARVYVKFGQMAEIDTTAADVVVVLEEPSAKNLGRSARVHVVRGTNQALVECTAGFGKRSSPISLDYAGEFRSFGDHVEYCAA